MPGIIGGTQFLDKPDSDSVYPRSVDMSELCVTGLVFSCRTLMFATTMAKGSWQHGTACAICPFLVRLGGRFTSASKDLHGPATRRCNFRPLDITGVSRLAMGNWTAANLQLPHGLS